TLAFQTAQQGVQRAFIYLHAPVRQCFSQGVSITLNAKLGEDGKDQTASTQFQPKVLKHLVVCGERVVYYVRHGVRRTLYDTQYSRVKKFWKKILNRRVRRETAEKPQKSRRERARRKIEGKLRCERDHSAKRNDRI